MDIFGVLPNINGKSSLWLGRLCQWGKSKKLSVCCSFRWALATVLWTLEIEGRPSPEVQTWWKLSRERRQMELTVLLVEERRKRKLYRTMSRDKQRSRWNLQRHLWKNWIISKTREYTHWYHCQWGTQSIWKNHQTNRPGKIWKSVQRRQSFPSSLRRPLAYLDDCWVWAVWFSIRIIKEKDVQRGCRVVFQEYECEDLHEREHLRVIDFKFYDRSSEFRLFQATVHVLRQSRRLSAWETFVYRLCSSLHHAGCPPWSYFLPSLW